MKFNPSEFLAQLPLPATPKWPDGVRDLEPFEKNGVRLVFFAPRGVDHQTSHDEDEFYFIISGRGDLTIGHESLRFEPGDAFFIPARADHHFENFTHDFACWAIFF